LQFPASNLRNLVSNLQLQHVEFAIDSAFDGRSPVENDDDVACRQTSTRRQAPMTTISVCIPARDEALTVGDLVRAVRQHPRANEVIVLDHASSDDTAAIARTAGAEVLNADHVLPEFGPALGKGDVLWRSVHVARGEVIVWLDADLRSYTDDYLTRLIEPLERDHRIALVRPDYARTLKGRPTGGGRITEQVAKPALRTWYPHLAHIRQPLAGEYAIRRSVATALAFEIDYGVEIGLLIDVAHAYGTDAIAQAALPARVHRNRSDDELVQPSQQVLRTALSRAGLAPLHSRPPLHGLMPRAVA
jgi:glucosyl-3-phosphoglycerate synthase